MPPVKLLSEGKPNEDVFRLIRTNTRVPDAVLGDIRAMVAAVRKGSQRVLDVIEQFGVDVTRAALTEILAQGERLARAAVRRIPDGVYEAEAILDGDGNDDNPLDEKLLLKMKITVDGDQMTADFTGTGPQNRGPMNTPEPSTISATRYAFKIITTPHQPSNEGFFRALDIIIPNGTFLKPEFPAACAMWPTASTTIPDLFLKALAPAIPDKIRAGHFGDSMANFIYGIHPDSGTYYVCAEADAGGYGGKPTEDGECALFSMTLGDTYNVPAEVVEVRYPWRVERFELAQDSGGPGKFRGGLGVHRDYKLGFDAGLTVTTDRVKYTPPWGVFGGKPGATNLTVVHRIDGSEEPWRKISNLPIRKDEIISFRGGGGGGYGSPLDRDPERVREDVIDEYVSIDKAREVYGVALREGTLELDIESTKALRAKLAAEGGSP